MRYNKYVIRKSKTPKKASKFARNRVIAIACAVCCLLVAALALTGCGKGDNAASPSASRDANSTEFPSTATKNTTRVSGKDAVVNAAAVALAAYPAKRKSERPKTVALVDMDDWRVAISAAQLFADPIGAPMLFSGNGVLPVASQETLDHLSPTGADKIQQEAQIISVGSAPSPAGYRTEKVSTPKVSTENLGRSETQPLAKADDIERSALLALDIDRLHSAAAGKPSNIVLVASADEPAYAMPAAAWSARSGHPVLWVSQKEIPAGTKAALADRKNPKIYILGPEKIISDSVSKRLAKHGRVQRIESPNTSDPSANAVEFARYHDGKFGWDIVDPGHGLVFANADNPLDAAAGAPLSGSGKYGPLLVLNKADKISDPLMNYLLDIQPGYESNPSSSVYNHAWLLGDESAITAKTQSSIDALLEIQKVSNTKQVY